MSKKVTKTGECKYRDEEGNLCLAESFVDENGEVFTETSIVEISISETEWQI